MDSKKLVGIWVRVSTDDQVKGESPEHHERRARAYAESKGWEVKKVYRLEAVSGKAIMDRPEAKQMLEDIRKGEISGLIFSKLARLARNTKELLEFSEIFRSCGADLISLQESIDTSSPAGRLFYTMIAAMAQWEREEIASRVAASVPIRAQMGKPLSGQSPFGYHWVDKKLVPDPKEVPVRKLIYELYLEHRRKKKVARILNERGYRTRTGTKWGYTSINRLISDSTAKGLHRRNYTRRGGKNYEECIIKPESEWIYNRVPAIVSEELWNQCNQIVEEQHQKRKVYARSPVHLFAGVAVCSCGGKMYVPSNSSKYVCRQCRNKIEAMDLESIFHEQLKSFLFSDQEIKQHLEKAHTALQEKKEAFETLVSEQEKVQKEMDNIMRLYQAGNIPPNGFRRYYDPLDERSKQLGKQIPDLQANIDFLKIQYLSSDEILHEARDLYSRWSEFTHEDKRKVIETITEKIVIGKSDVTISLCYMPSATPTEKSPDDLSSPPPLPQNTPNSPPSPSIKMMATNHRTRTALKIFFPSIMRFLRTVQPSDCAFTT